MRVLKKVVLLIIIAIIIQGSILLFLDKYYFEADANVSLPTVAKVKEKSVLIKVSAKSKEFKVSYDGMYLAYLDANQLNVINTVLGTIEKVKIVEESTISFYKWFPDNNKIIYALNVPSSKGDVIKFFYYDIKNNSSEEVRGLNTNNSLAIEGVSSNSKISDIILSTVTSVMYVKLTNIDGKSLIYKLENMNSMNKTQVPESLIGTIKITPIDGMLYYMDVNTNKIKNILGNSIDIPKVEKPVILGSDSTSNIYIGDVLNSKITKIYWGILTGSSNNFNSKELEPPTAMNDIYITLQGKICINNGLMGEVTDLISGVQTPYIGVFKCMYDKGIVSIDEEKVVKTPFK